VLTTIDAKDLIAHFAPWLVARDAKLSRAIHPQNVIRIAIEEFKREQSCGNWLRSKFRR
jgi:hypothetical protein